MKCDVIINRSKCTAEGKHFVLFKTAEEKERRKENGKGEYAKATKTVKNDQRERQRETDRRKLMTERNRNVNGHANGYRYLYRQTDGQADRRTDGWMDI